MQFLSTKSAEFYPQKKTAATKVYLETFFLKEYEKKSKILIKNESDSKIQIDRFFSDTCESTETSTCNLSANEVQIYF